MFSLDTWNKWNVKVLLFATPTVMVRLVELTPFR